MLSKAKCSIFHRRVKSTDAEQAYMKSKLQFLSLALAHIAFFPSHSPFNATAQFSIQSNKKHIHQLCLQGTRNLLKRQVSAESYAGQEQLVEESSGSPWEEVLAWQLREIIQAFSRH